VGRVVLSQPAQLSDVAAFFALMDELVSTGRLTPENLQAETASLYAPPDPLAGIGLADDDHPQIQGARIRYGHRPRPAP
jgi:hypothetical protein